MPAGSSSDFDEVFHSLHVDCHPGAGRHNIPAVFGNFNYRDVTSGYDLPLADVKIQVSGEGANNKLMYLAVFSPQGWSPIAWGEIRGGKVRFDDMGTGYNAKQLPSGKGDNLGDGILYQAVRYNGVDQVAEGNPFILRPDGTKEDIVADTDNLGTVILTRKYPKLQRIRNYARAMNGGVFEVAGKPDFSDGQEIYRITSAPESRVQGVVPETHMPGRYFRYFKHSDGISIASFRLMREVLQGTSLERLQYTNPLRRRGGRIRAAVETNA